MTNLMQSAHFQQEQGQLQRPNHKPRGALQSQTTIRTQNCCITRKCTVKEVLAGMATDTTPGIDGSTTFKLMSVRKILFSSSKHSTGENIKVGQHTGSRAHINRQQSINLLHIRSTLVTPTCFQIVEHFKKF